jgi:hypothetical protein
MYLFLYTYIHTYAIVFSMMRGIPASLLVSSARATHTHTVSLSHTHTPDIRNCISNHVHKYIRVYVYTYTSTCTYIYAYMSSTCVLVHTLVHTRTLPASLVMSARARISETTPPGFARLSAHRSFTLGLLHALRTCQCILNSQRHITLTL